MFASLFNKQSDRRLKDQVAQMLKLNPEQLHAFEQAYRQAALTDEPMSDNFFDMNSRQASQLNKDQAQLPEKIDTDLLQQIISRSVDELTARTNVLAISDGQIKAVSYPALPEGS